MAKQIALNLTINGVKQNVKSINDLERAIASAQEELKGLEIGSEQFKKLTNEVNQAKSAFKDLEKSFEGQELEQRVGAFAKLGEGITASFAGAQAAISLFGNESEAVAEAAAKAQSVLTIALAARSAAESVVAVRTVAANIATFASAAAANAANVATRALWATLAANPYGAILAVIGAVIAAVITLTGEQKEQINVQKELSAATSQEADQLRQQLTILTKYTGLKNLQKKTIEDLKKEYPGFNAFLDKENKLTQDGIKFLSLKIKQYELESRAKLLVQKISETNIKLLEIENTATTEYIGIWEQFWNGLKTGGNVWARVIADAKTASENQKKALDEVRESQNVYIKGLEALQPEIDAVYGQLEVYNKELENQVDKEEKAAQAVKNAAEQQKAVKSAYREGFDALVNYTKVLTQYTDANKKLDEQLQKLTANKYEAKILEQLKEVSDLRKESIKQLETATQSYLNTIEKISKVPNEDQFIKNFGRFRSALEEEFNSASGQFSKITESIFGDLSKLTQDQKILIKGIEQSYSDFFKFLKSTPGFDEFIKKFSLLSSVEGAPDQLVEGYAAFNQILGVITANLGIYRKEIDENGNILDVTFDPAEVKKTAELFLSSLKNDLLIPTQIEFDKSQKKIIEDQKKAQQAIIDASTKGSERRNKAEIELSRLNGQLAQIEKRVATLTSDITSEEALQKGLISDDVKKSVDANLEAIVKFSSGVIKVEQDIIGVNEEVNKLKSGLTDAQLGKALAGLVRQNIEAISDSLIGARTEAQKAEADFLEKAKMDYEGQAAFREDLLKKGLINEKTTYEDLLESFIIYKRKEVETNKKAEEEKRNQQQKTLRALQLGFDTFSQTIGQINSVYQDAVKIEIDRLTQAQQKALENVVGDSQEAADKRLEIEKEYTQQKKKLEKEAQITALRITLAQTVANAASAAVRAIAELGPIAGPILAAVNGAIAIAQIANIQNQISAVQSLRRGGLIKQKTAAGGMLLSGPSHENGGIPLAQYGVLAEGQEAIINRQSTVNFRDLLSTINQSGGGRPLVVNNFDDSRIVEAIASQKQVPLRAYVLQSEITNEQAISKRLDDLSKI